MTFELHNARNFKAFVIVKHSKYGYLVLKSASDKSKKLGQCELPGGRLEENDFVGESDQTKIFQRAAARELFEETGIDVRYNMQRLIKFENTRIPRKWQFFYLEINDDDLNNILKSHYDKNYIKKSSSGEGSILRLSSEHDSFMFIKDLKEAAKSIQRHSQGVCSKALILLDNPETSIE
ncbi:NUDIX family protein [Cryptosporidium andersoni]|uniref:NUDIX family protein n=1 Tax=Cryptosporidium andersoni TaxID=117008 RepID=A0A1J4MUM8_9CRYT|nr:NUDIX family protein [Cryptosporidium andersoni]